MARLKANIYSVALGENGDLGFGALCAGFALAAFVVGAWTRNWWTVLAVAAAWFIGWMLAASTLAADTYTWAIAFFAPGVALFVAFGVGAGRRRASRP